LAGSSGCAGGNCDITVDISLQAAAMAAARSKCSDGEGPAGRFVRCRAMISALPCRIT
jgi:hypothetical protein